MKKAKQGLGYIVDKHWNKRLFKSVKDVIKYGQRNIPKYLKEIGFEVTVFECENYFRLNYGKIIK